MESVDFLLGIRHDEVTFLMDFLETFDSLCDVGLGLDFDESLDFFFFAIVFWGLSFGFGVAV